MNHRWSNLPNELLEKIVNNLGQEKQKLYINSTEWMFVNRQWFHFHQSIKYKTISMDATSSDKTLNNILHSKFYPGRWVNTIKFQSFTTTSADKQELFLLMEKCPQVINVDLPVGMKDTDWQFFLTMITAPNHWKLCKIVVPFRNVPEYYYYYYYQCAYSMRNSLLYLKISSGMITDCSILREFKKLTTLDIEAFPNGFYCCHQYLHYLPHLEGLKASIGPRSDTSLLEEGLRDHRSLRKICLYYDYDAVPRNQDLLIMMDNFSRLGNLSVEYASERDDTTENLFRSSILNSFCRYTTTPIQTYRLSWYNSSAGDGQLFKAYVQHSDQPIHLIITPYIEDTSSVVVEKNIGDNMIKIKLNIGKDVFHDAEILKTFMMNTIFTFDNETIRQVDVDFKDIYRENTAYHEFGFHLARYKKLQQINIMNGILTCLTSTGFRYNTLDQLKLSYCNVDVVNFFPSLSKGYQFIDRLDIHNCWFTGHQFNIDSYINVSLIDTEVNVLCLSDDKLIDSLMAADNYILLLSVTCIDQDISKRYVYAEDVDKKDEITSRNMFDALADTLDPQKTVVIDIKVKSIKAFILKIERITLNAINITISFSS